MEAEVMTRADVHAELGQIVAGLRRGRRSESEIIVFDSTGTALQDTAAAVLVYEAALQTRRGRWIDFQRWKVGTREERKASRTGRYRG
jgi:ornithine cyclodeaminase/alanine dehydrogenase